MPSGSRHWVGGSTRAHRKARALVLTRAGHRCQVRDERVCTVVATEAHHVLGRGVTGDDAAHMIAACRPCNLAIGDPIAHDPQPRPMGWW
jgi:hypothetical protein